MRASADFPDEAAGVQAFYPASNKAGADVPETLVMQLRELFSDAESVAVGLVTSFLVLGVLWALANCFLGYVIFRVSQVVSCVVVAVLSGSVLAAWLWAEPSRLDYLVLCGSMAILGGLAAWFFWRTIFALTIAIPVAYIVSLVSHWTLGGLAGVAVAVALFVMARPMILFLSALGGAIGAVFGIAEMAAGTQQNLSRMLVGPQQKTWLIVLLWLLVAVLAAAGVFVQERVSRLIRSPWAPETKKANSRQKRGGSKRLGSRVHPRFAAK